jgi:hypothetical protein
MSVHRANNSASHLILSIWYHDSAPRGIIRAVVQTAQWMQLSMVAGLLPGISRPIPYVSQISTSAVVGAFQYPAGGVSRSI